jgi:hypothetical protein
MGINYSLNNRYNELTKQVAYTYLISPLSAIPNASFLSPLSSLAWKFLTEHNGKITLKLPELHKKFGAFLNLEKQTKNKTKQKLYGNLTMIRSPSENRAYPCIILLIGDIQGYPCSWKCLCKGSTSL